MHNDNTIRAIFVSVIAIIVLTILLPILALVFGTFWSDSPVSPTGYLTLENWFKAFTISIPASIPELFVNSLLFSLVAAAISVALGLVMAFLVERTDVPYGHLFERLSIMPRAFPVMIAAFAWIMLLSPRIGVVNLLCREILGVPLFNIYSFPGMVFLLVLYESPIVFVIAVNALRLMDPSLEEQSIVCGNGVVGTVLKITLPVLRPLVLSSFMLVFIVGLITLEIPLLIGVPGGIFVFITAIFQLIASETQSLVQYNIAAALAMMITPICLATLYVYRKSVKSTEKFVTVAGAARPKKVHSLGIWRYAVLAVLAIYFFVVMILPTLVIVLVSLSEFISSPSLDLLTHLTLRHWFEAFEDPVFWRALRNTLVLAFVAASAGVTLALALGYLLIRTGIRLKGTIEASAMLPLAFPGTVLAIGFVWGYIKTPIYGTLWILLFYFIGNYLPFALRALSPFLFQFHKQLEEASWMCGAGTLKTLVRIIIPFLMRGLFSVWILLFQLYLREFSGAIILFSFGTEVLSTLLFWKAIEEGSLGVGAVLGVLMLAMSLLLHAIIIKRT